jgi:hypothetical protein
MIQSKPLESFQRIVYGNQQKHMRFRGFLNNLRYRVIACSATIQYVPGALDSFQAGVMPCHFG